MVKGVAGGGKWESEEEVGRRGYRGNGDGERGKEGEGGKERGREGGRGGEKARVRAAHLEEQVNLRLREARIHQPTIPHEALESGAGELPPSHPTAVAPRPL